MQMQVWYKFIAMTISALSIAGVSAAQEAGPPPVFVQTMVLGDAAPQSNARQFFGRIAALETADLSFEVGGYLALLNAQEGTRVEEGQLLAQLDLEPFERAVERAELSLTQAERDLERANKLASRNVTSQVQADNAETARDLADVALREARDALRDAQIKAPFDGLIADRVAASFTTIAPGQPIVRLHNLSETRVEFDLPERIFSQVGDPSRVSFSTVLPGQVAPTRLEFREFKAETGSVGQSYTISLALTDPAAPVLLPGKTVVIQAALTAQTDGFEVPGTAIATTPDGSPFVVALEETSEGLIAKHIAVETKSDTGTRFLVTGPESGTEIVEIGAHLIKPDMPLARYGGLTVEGN